MILAEANCRLKQLITTSRLHIGSGTDIPFLGFEYDAAAAALMEITLQHAEAFYELAKCDERFFFSAASCARSAMEFMSSGGERRSVSRKRLQVSHQASL